MSEDSKRETGYLDLPDAQPLGDRPRLPESETLDEGWKLQIIIGEQMVLLDITNTIVVGRFIEGDDPDIPMLDLTPFDGYQNGVSRRHATISQQANLLYIEDHGSTNGTRINGFQLTPRRKYRLRDGDEVEFSRLNTIFRFVRAD